MIWEGLSPPYGTIVADPPWHYDARVIEWGRSEPMPYGTMSLPEIAAMPVGAMAAPGSHLYLWTTNRYIFDAKTVAEAWGFRYSKLLVWAKTPMGIGPGGTWAQSTEYVLFCRRGSLKALTKFDSTWFNWKRTAKHSAKPDAFLDMVEQASPGPYLELFARRARFGWDYWGDQSLGTDEMEAA